MQIPFQLLNLPCTVLRKILPCLKIDDTLELGLKSHKFRKAIRQYRKITAHTLSWNILKTEIQIVLKFDGFTDRICFKPLENCHTSNVSQLQFSVRRRRASLDIFCIGSVNEDSSIIMHKCSSILLELLRVEDYELRLECSKNFDLSHFFVWNFTTHFSFVEFSPTNGEDFHKLTFLQNRVTTDILQLSQYKIDNVYHRKQIQLPVLTQSCVKISLMNFGEISNLFKMEVKRLEVYKNCSITCKKINELFKHWISGGMEHLEVFTADQGFYDTHKLLEGIEMVDLSSHRPAHPDSDFMSMCETKKCDIQRSVDGRRATIFRDCKKVSLMVWPADITS
ncbi:F-box domain-containing protein [Caenorhabditis elegans]|uniref:F-box domain-containing protein n=1 Tax=Caenorhabditis elegans TaxID=6239 RepID=B5BM42_CAEEL|nr:F-box domain-containing protein [Caenorhabditis elegans]CAR31499.3 F-box domain-containing protein [Caenorhabditis elegans]